MPEPATHHVTKMALRSRTRRASACACERMLDVNAPMTIALSVCSRAEYPCAKFAEMNCAARLHLRKAALLEDHHDERGLVPQLRETALRNHKKIKETNKTYIKSLTNQNIKNITKIKNQIKRLRDEARSQPMNVINTSCPTALMVREI